MLWTIIDALESNELEVRAKELRKVLNRSTDSDIVEFHSEAVAAELQIFTPETLRLYCAVFDGEVNYGGFTDFCSNIILAGHSFFQKTLENPDNFSTVINPVQFNDDHDSVSNMGRYLLIERHGEERAWPMLQHVDELDGIWDRLKGVSWQPDWPAIREKMPRVYARWGMQK